MNRTPMHHAGHSQQGFAVVAAVFLVVVLAALGGFMVSISNTQHLTQAQDIQGTRAYWAARAGLEWGVGRVLAASACPAASSSLAVEGFTVVVTCTATAYVDNGNRTVYQFVSTASGGGGVGTVERSVSSAMEQ